MNRKVIAALVGAIVVAAGGYFGYAEFREWYVQKEFRHALARNNREAVQKAATVESYTQLREFYDWQVASLMQVIDEHHAKAPPRGRRMLELVREITQRLDAYYRQSFTAADLFEELAGESPGTVARREDFDALVARIEAAAVTLQEAPTRHEAKREEIRKLVSGSGADKDTRVELWQSFQPSFDAMARQVEAMPRRAAKLTPYVKMLHYLRARRDRYTVDDDGTILFHDHRALWEFQDLQRAARLAGA